MAELYARPQSYPGRHRGYLPAIYGNGLRGHERVADHGADNVGDLRPVG
jgi:hypothetical protein